MPSFGFRGSGDQKWKKSVLFCLGIRIPSPASERGVKERLLNPGALLKHEISSTHFGAALMANGQGSSALQPGSHKPLTSRPPTPSSSACSFEDLSFDRGVGARGGPRAVQPGPGLGCGCLWMSEGDRGGARCQGRISNLQETNSGYYAVATTQSLGHFTSKQPQFH